MRDIISTDKQESGVNAVRSRGQLFVSIFQLIVGIAAVIAFAIAVFSGENMVKWIITLILAIAFIVLGIIGIINYKSDYGARS